MTTQASQQSGYSKDQVMRALTLACEEGLDPRYLAKAGTAQTWMTTPYQQLAHRYRDVSEADLIPVPDGNLSPNLMRNVLPYKGVTISLYARQSGTLPELYGLVGHALRQSGLTTPEQIVAYVRELRGLGTYKAVLERLAEDFTLEGYEAWLYGTSLSP